MSTPKLSPTLSSPAEPPAAPAAGKLGKDFNLLWAGQTVSHVGDRITLFVVPTVLVFVLGASAFEIGLVSMAQYLAIPVLSLVAGALVDRWDLRRLLIACDLIRFGAIALIPVAYWQGFLSVPLVFACVAVVSAATVFFNIGYMPAVASIVDAKELVRGNSRLEASRTVSEVGGPAAAGGLYHGLGVAALLVDAFTYLLSAAAIRGMRQFGERSGQGQRILTRLMVGVRKNYTDPILRRSTARDAAGQHRRADLRDADAGTWRTKGWGCRRGCSARSCPWRRWGRCSGPSSRRGRAGGSGRGGCLPCRWWRIRWRGWGFWRCRGTRARSCSV